MLCKWSVISYFSAIRGYFERQVHQVKLVTGFMGVREAGRAQGRGGQWLPGCRSCQWRGNQARGKVTNLICLSFSCCWIPSVFPHGVSRSHLGSYRQKDFFSSRAHLMMVRQNEDVIDQWSLLFYKMDYFQSALACSHWQMKLKFPGCFQKEGPMCPQVQGNFRLFCAQKWTGSWAVLIPYSCTEGNFSWITVFASRAAFGGRFSGTALWGSLPSGWCLCWALLWILSPPNWSRSFQGGVF